MNYKGRYARKSNEMTQQMNEAHMPQPSTTFRILAVFGILLITNIACSLGRNATLVPDAPTITLTSPLPGQVASVGEPLAVNSTSVDADGIQRIELWVDDQLVRVDSNPDENSPYIVSQPWQSDAPGTHVILVKAFDAQGVEGKSQPVVITLQVEAQTLLESTAVAETSPTPGEEGSSSSEPVPTQTSTPPPLKQTTSPTPQPPTNTPGVMCTPPPCQAGEVYYCPGTCPGGCGTQCATPTPSVTPPSFEPTGIEVHRVLKPIWEKPGVKDYLGYPIKAAGDDRRYARQYFERGYLYWWDRPNAKGLIWAIEISQPSAKQGMGWTGPFEDVWDGGDPYSCDAARANPDGPVRGFGKLWCDHPEIAGAIGAARGSEQGTGDTTNYGVMQPFQGGVMLYSPLDREVWILFDGGNWQRYPR
jgi:hypothetical protein